jgi:hypothetical protein
MSAARHAADLMVRATLSPDGDHHACTRLAGSAAQASLATMSETQQQAAMREKDRWLWRKVGGIDGLADRVDYTQGQRQASASDAR